MIKIAEHLSLLHTKQADAHHVICVTRAHAFSRVINRYICKSSRTAFMQLYSVNKFGLRHVLGVRPNKATDFKRLQFSVGYANFFALTKYTTFRIVSFSSLIQCWASGAMDCSRGSTLHINIVCTTFYALTIYIMMSVAMP